MSTQITRGHRVRLRRTWHVTGQADVCVTGTVAEYAQLDNGQGALLLRDVPTGMEGYWAAPSSDSTQTTTLEVLPEVSL